LSAAFLVGRRTPDWVLAEGPLTSWLLAIGMNVQQRRSSEYESRRLH
jgi:hypothetical protein